MRCLRRDDRYETCQGEMFRSDEAFLMITRRESKIKPFIIENSWRGKYFLLFRLSRRALQGLNGNSHHVSLNWYFWSFEWASNSFHGTSKLRDFHPARNSQA